MPRMRFSLSTLCLLMAAVGVTLAWYRWPWTVNQRDTNRIITTEYRRGWNGEALKHGLRRTVGTWGDETSKEWFVDGELRRSREEKGSWFSDKSFRGGKLYGPYHYRSDAYFAEGTYWRGKEDGLWKMGYPTRVLITVEWQKGKRHGAKTWSSPQGKILQTARFEEDRLVEWNGLPLREALEDWARKHVTDRELRQTLLRQAQDIKRNAFETVFSADESLPRITVTTGLVRSLDETTADQSIGERLLSEILKNESTLAYRYHQICVVAISADEEAWRDRTGVYAIQFEPGSQEEEFWLGRGVVDTHFSKHTGNRLKGMLHAESGFQIECDTTACDAQPSLTYYFEPNAPNNQTPRVRRDQVGEYLDAHGWYCELRGKILVIKPHPDAKQELRK